MPWVRAILSTAAKSPTEKNIYTLTNEFKKASAAATGVIAEMDRPRDTASTVKSIMDMPRPGTPEWPNQRD